LKSPKYGLAVLYAGTLMLGILTEAGRLGGADSAAMFNVARSIAHRGTFEASPCQPAPRSNHCVPGVDGRLYAGFGLLPSALVAPPLIAGERLANITHKDPYLLGTFLVSFSTLFVGALIPVVLVLWLTRLGFSWTPSVVTALLLFFGTVLWFESVKGFYSEPFFALGILAAAYFACTARGAGGFLLAGFVFGCSIGCRVFGLIFAPVFAAYCFALPNAGRWTQRLSRAVIFTIGTLPPLALVAWTNYSRFGGVTKSGYHLAYPTVAVLLANPLLEGLRDILFNGEVGLVWFTPWIVLVPLAFVRFWRLRRLECALALAIVVESCLFFACYISWHGGWSYGPRLLSPCLPFAALPLLVLFEGWRKKPIGARIVFATVAVASVLVQLSGMPYPAARYYQILNYETDHHEPNPWHGSLLLAQWEELPAVMRDSVTTAPPSRTSVNESAEPTPLSDESLSQASKSVAEFLASFPNAVNLTSADLWLVKARKMGFPSPIVGALSLALLIGGVGLIGLAWRAPPLPDHHG
jgi:hypothetical protein